jgi:CRISPR-associated protein Cas4
LYFHSLYEDFDQNLYHETSQKAGKLKHENIENGTYSSLKKFVQALSVYSEKYNLMGKIDIFDKNEGILIERKNKVTKIYDGYKYQLYAQMFCLEEMGCSVNKLIVHSLQDNKRYEVAKPNDHEILVFENLIKEINGFNVFTAKLKTNPEKCQKCIYRELCDKI